MSEIDRRRDDGTETGAGGPALEVFERERGRLFGVAYRMLGTVRDAEDVLQDAWLRWQEVAHADIANPTSYLVRMVTRLCIDVSKAAHARRMEYVGQWLPEPLVDAAAERPSAADPAELHELADDLSMAFMLMLERLSPVERAVFLLRESFGFGYAEIARVVGKTEANCRQIERRARRRLRDGGRPRSAEPGEHDRLLTGFLSATRDGDVDALVELLAEEVASYTDSGGKVPSARRQVRGARNVARFYVGVTRKAAELGAELRLAPVNGRTGLLFYLGGRLGSVITLHVANGRIDSFYVVVNPDKLAAVERGLDA